MFERKKERVDASAESVVGLQTYFLTNPYDVLFLQRQP
jgi:hypothetical protein